MRTYYLSTTEVAAMAGILPGVLRRMIQQRKIVPVLHLGLGRGMGAKFTQQQAEKIVAWVRERNLIRSRGVTRIC